MKNLTWKIYAIILPLLVLLHTADAQMGIGTTSPNSTLDVRGSVSTSYRAFTGATTAGSTDNLLVFTGTSATTITLPTAVGCTGRSYVIKNASTTGPTPLLTVATTSSQTIDGAGSWLLDDPNESVSVISNGTNWNVASQTLPSGSGTSWTQGGNGVGSLKNIGTTSNYDLPIITNNTEKMRITAAGRVGIGTSTFDATNPEKLLVDAGSTSSYNVISGKGTIDNYLQLNIQNKSAGNNASSDVVATADNGSETANYIDMGINSSTYNAAAFNVTAANDAYLYSTGNDLAIGNATSNKSIKFFTGGTVSGNERMRIDGSGDVGIGTTTIPRAGVGAAKFAIHGTNSSMSGPHMQFTTSADNYPLMQVLPWTHDNSFLMFDSYWDGSNWKSSTSTGGNFMFTKTAGLLQMNYANVNTQGNTISSFNYGIVLNPTGNVGVGSASFDGTNPEKLLVDAGTTSSYNVISGKGTIDNYLQLNIQNKSNTANASSDVVATAANGNESSNFIDMGINSGNYSNATYPVLNGANNAYIYATGNDFVIGNGTASKNLIFFNGGYATTNEKLRINSSGYVGVSNSSPTSTLHVTGSVAMSTVTKTANYTATASDYTIICNNSSGAITINLPTASGCSGRVYAIKKVSGVALNVTIDPFGSENIDGASTRILSVQYEGVLVQSDGSNWYVISKI
ncbi:MAG: hypothetical protein U0V75_12855 [Ferruginibacter sp.]